MKEVKDGSDVDWFAYYLAVSARQRQHSRDCSPVLNPHFIARSMATQTDHAASSWIRSPSPPIVFHRSPSIQRRTPVCLRRPCLECFREDAGRRDHVEGLQEDACLDHGEQVVLP